MVLGILFGAGFYVGYELADVMLQFGYEPETSDIGDPKIVTGIFSGLLIVVLAISAHIAP